MKALIAASVLLTTLASGLAIPERMKHGSWYQEVLKNQDAHHSKIGFKPNTTASFVTMPLDHNDPSYGTFQDRFFFDTTYWNQESGPCMFYLNGEGPLNSAIGGYMADLAKNFSACTVAIEHRWYGESYPKDQGTNKTLFTKTLNVHSAMEDIIFLMNYFQTKVFNKPNLTWFLVGGSYSGGMTMWMNERYPKAFKASWAASGVVRATFAFSEYDGHVKAVTPKDCSDKLIRLTKIAERLWPTNQSRLQKMFGTGPISQPGFMTSLQDGSFSSVQYSGRTAMCAALADIPKYGDDWAALQFWAETTKAYFGPDFFAMSACRYEPHTCAHNKKLQEQAGLPAGLIAAANGTPTFYPNTYSWEWQICSEMAWWIIGYPGSVQSANVSVSYYMDQCREIFYADTFPDTWKFNQVHHGLFPQTDAPVIATQGSDDPWSTTGLSSSPRPNIAYNMANCVDCGHCSSMMSPMDSDAVYRPNLVKQRLEVRNFLAKHLGIN